MKKSIITTLLFFLFVGGALTSNAQCKADFQYWANCNTVQFYDSSFTSGVMHTYSWDFGDGSSSTSHSPSHLYAKAGTYKVTLIVTALDSFRKKVCTDTVSKSISVKTLCCKADFYTQVNGSTLYLYDRSTKAHKYEMNWGDGSAAGSNGTRSYWPHTYKKAGTYTVCLKITDTITNCTDSICKQVTIKGSTNCKASFTFSHPNKKNSTIFFTNTSTPSTGLNYYWNFGDGSSAYTKDSSHTYNSPGTYRVCLTVYDSSRSCSNTYCAMVTVAQTGCKAAFTYYNAGNNNIYFSNQSTRYKIYKWTFGDGTSSSKQYPTKTYAKAGKYTVCLVVTDSLKSCSDSICKTITVDSSSCDATFTYTVDTTNNKVTFTPSSTDTNLNHSWWVYRSGTIGSSGTTFTKTFPKGGTFDVCHYVDKRDSNSFCSDTFCATIKLPKNSACDGSFTYKITDTTKRTVTFTANATGSNVEYDWYLGDGTTSKKKSFSHTYKKAGYYTVFLNVTQLDSNKRVICSDSTVMAIYFNQQSQCNAKFRAIADSSTKFKIKIINQSTGKNLNYMWSFGDGGTSTSKNPKHKYKKFGLYNVCLTVYDSSCRSTYCDTIGMDSTGKMLKAEGFEIEVFDEQSGSSKTINIAEATVYPNPFTNVLTITADKNSKGISNIRLIDMKGQLINAPIENLSSNSVRVNTSEMPKGMYIINYTQDGVSQTKRIIKVE